MIKTGFIGTGNMGSAIISGMIKENIFDISEIYAYDKIQNNALTKSGINYVDLETLVGQCDYIVLAVKPANIFEVIESLKSHGDISSKVFISIAAGVTLEKLSNALESNRIIRVMPNLCLTALEGMSVLSRTSDVDDNQMEFAKRIFSCAGKVIEVKEELIDSCTAINGSGPAYVFMFMEAMADAAVKYGIDRKTAYTLSAQTVLGSAALMLETGLHPANLKDMVCSPAGTTIEALAALEESGFRSAVIKAVDACVQKAKNIK